MTIDLNIGTVATAVGLLGAMFAAGWKAHAIEHARELNAALAKAEAAEQARAQAEAELARRPMIAVTFHRARVDGQVGGQGEWLMAQLQFTIDLDGQRDGDYRAEVRLPAGERYASRSPFVSAPIGYSGAFNQEAFADAAVRYLRKAFDVDGMLRGANYVSGIEGVVDWTASFRADTPASR